MMISTTSALNLKKNPNSLQLNIPLRKPGTTTSTNLVTTVTGTKVPPVRQTVAATTSRTRVGVPQQPKQPKSILKKSVNNALPIQAKISSNTSTKKPIQKAASQSQAATTPQQPLELLAKLQKPSAIFPSKRDLLQGMNTQTKQFQNQFMVPRRSILHKPNHPRRRSRESEPLQPHEILDKLSHNQPNFECIVQEHPMFFRSRQGKEDEKPSKTQVPPKTKKPSITGVPPPGRPVSPQRIWVPISKSPRVKLSQIPQTKSVGKVLKSTSPNIQQRQITGQTKKFIKAHPEGLKLFKKKTVEENPIKGGKNGPLVLNMPSHQGRRDSTIVISNVKDLRCYLCNEYFIKATTLNCSHTFCQSCLVKWEKNNEKCPVCSIPIERQYATKVLDNLIARLLKNASKQVKNHRSQLIRKRFTTLIQEKREKYGILD